MPSLDVSVARRSKVLAVAAIVLSCLYAAHRRSIVEGWQLPTFRSAVDLVALDVLVTDADGRPVAGLTADDFEVVENGSVRPIASFEAVSVSMEGDRGASNAQAPDADVLTNERPVARSYVIALDEIGADDALRVRTFLRAFLERNFGPQDVAAVVLVGRGLATDGQSFTGNPGLLLRAVEKLSGGFSRGSVQPPGCLPAGSSGEIHVDSSSGGRAPLPNNPVNTNDFAVRQRMAALRALVEALVTVPSAKKTVLYFTSCIGFDMLQIADYRGGVLGLAAEDAQRTIAAASRANVVFYPLDPRGLSLDGDTAGLKALEDRADLAALARVTGGFALSNSNRFLQAFDRIEQETRVFYALGFQSGYERRDGRFVPVEVRVKRPGLRVRTRDGYVAPLGRAPSGKADSLQLTPAAEALAHSIATSGVTIRASAAPFKSTDKEAVISLAVEVDTGAREAAAVSGMPDGEIEIVYTAVDARNRAFPGGRHTIPTSSARPSRTFPGTSVQLASALTLPPGQYQLRIAASVAGRTGSLVYDLEVPDFGEPPLSLSGVVLATAGEGDVVRPKLASKSIGKPVNCKPPTCVVPLLETAASVRDPIATLAAMSPTTRRVFNRAEQFALYAELYAGGRAPARATRLDVSLEAPDGRSLALASESRAAVQKGRQPLTEAYTVRPSLRDVPPGRYVLRVDGSIDGGSPAVTRRIAIEVD